MRVLVTGAAGHLGALVVARLARAGHRVRALDLPRRGSMRRLAAHGAAVEPFPGDVGDRRRLA
ncbi:MAG: NmrA family NAD(P)-binding protein, partial [Myxococcales bacterium]|nr:NmrA family NAD(P)-binding protein [Myxococcales bacterium]